MAESKTATFIGPAPGDWKGDARLYRLDPPIPWEGIDDEAGDAEHVIVSAADAFGMGLETFIFPANKDGELLDWGELPGSFKGASDHERALGGAGYEVS